MQTRNSTANLYRVGSPSEPSCLVRSATGVSSRANSYKFCKETSMHLIQTAISLYVFSSFQIFFQKVFDFFHGMEVDLQLFSSFLFLCRMFWHWVWTVHFACNNCFFISLYSLSFRKELVSAFVLFISVLFLVKI